MTKEDIIFNIKYRIITLKSLSPKELEANKGNLWELEDLLSMIKNEEEPVSEDLEEAVHEYMQHIPESEPELMDSFYTWEQMEAAFKAGAKWQFLQLENNRLAACDRQTDEERKREQDFVDKVLIGEHRQPTFSDAIEYGIKWYKEQITKSAHERKVQIDAGGYPYINSIELWDYDIDKPLAKDGDKVKVVIIKDNGDGSSSLL